MLLTEKTRISSSQNSRFTDVNVKNLITDMTKVINNSLDKTYDDDFLKRYTLDKCEKILKEIEDGTANII